jgi:probable rRNA maturation factor
VRVDLVLDGVAEAGLDPVSLERLVTGVLDELPVGDGTCALSIRLVGDAEIRALNREHRALDEVTDVLSFPVDGLDPLPGDMERELGDVVISLPQARRQAETAGVPELEELGELVVHGVLHLAGFDHETDSGEMFELQDRLVDSLPPIEART